MSEAPARSLGTIILTDSITHQGELEGKIQDDGSSVVVNGVTYSSVNDWINDIYVKQEIEQEMSN